jgi:hypothetical protein
LISSISSISYSTLPSAHGPATRPPPSLRGARRGSPCRSCSSRPRRAPRRACRPQALCASPRASPPLSSCCSPRPCTRTCFFKRNLSGHDRLRLA